MVELCQTTPQIFHTNVRGVHFQLRIARQFLIERKVGDKFFWEGGGGI